MIDLSGVKLIKKVYLQSHSAEPSPPLGTVLGNIGCMLQLFVYYLMVKRNYCLYIFY